MAKCKIHPDGNVNDFHNKTPNTDCTCEGNNGSDRGPGMGPATDPDLVAKREKKD